MTELYVGAFGALVCFLVLLPASRAVYRARKALLAAKIEYIKSVPPDAHVPYIPSDSDGYLERVVVPSPPAFTWGPRPEGKEIVIGRFYITKRSWGDDPSYCEFVVLRPKLLTLGLFWKSYNGETFDRTKELEFLYLDGSLFVLPDDPTAGYCLNSCKSEEPTND